MGRRLFRQEDTNRLIQEALDRAGTEKLRDVYTEAWVQQQISEQKAKYEAAKKELLWRERLKRGWSPNG